METDENGNIDEMGEYELADGDYFDDFNDLNAPLHAMTDFTRDPTTALHLHDIDLLKDLAYTGIVIFCCWVISDLEHWLLSLSPQLVTTLLILFLALGQITQLANNTAAWLLEPHEFIADLHVPAVWTALVCFFKTVAILIWICFGNILHVPLPPAVGFVAFGPLSFVLAVAVQTSAVGTFVAVRDGLVGRRKKDRKNGVMEFCLSLFFFSVWKEGSSKQRTNFLMCGFPCACVCCCVSNEQKSGNVLHNAHSRCGRNTAVGGGVFEE